MEAFDWLEVMKRFLLGHPAGREVGTAASRSRLRTFIVILTETYCGGELL